MMLVVIEKCSISPGHEAQIKINFKYTLNRYKMTHNRLRTIHEVTKKHIISYVTVLVFVHSNAAKCSHYNSSCINHNLSKAVWQAGCNAALIAKDKRCSLSGYLSSQACR